MRKRCPDQRQAKKCYFGDAIRTLVSMDEKGIIQIETSESVLGEGTHNRTGVKEGVYQNEKNPAFN